MARIDLPPFPNGWFAVALSAELAPGDITTCTYFGEELVVLRDQAGDGRGTRCRPPPFGGTPRPWWDCRQRLHQVPVSRLGLLAGRRLHRDALRRTYSTEGGGALLARHGTGRRDPRVARRGWCGPDMVHAVVHRSAMGLSPAMLRTVCSHPQEILENTVDYADFRFVHQTHIVRPLADVKVDGPTLEVVIASDPDAVSEAFRLTGSLEVAGSTFCHGPGLAAATIGSPDGGLPTLQRLYATPLDGEHVHLRGLVSVQIEEDPVSAEEWADLIAPPVFENWDKDIAIWQYKRYRQRPVLNSSERAIPVFRRWYAQFYAADAVPLRVLIRFSW